MVPITQWTPASRHMPCVLQGRVGRGEVHDDVGVAEHVQQRSRPAADPPGPRAPCPRRPRPRRRPSAPIRPAAPETATLIMPPAERRDDGLERGPELVLVAAHAGGGHALRLHSSRASSFTSSSVTASMAASSSSTVSSGTPISTELPSRFIRVSVDSIDSTVRPFTLSRARSSSSSVTPSSLQPAQLGADHVHRLAHVVRPRAHVQRHLAGVRVLARVRVDRIGQPALLAHLLEQARGGRAAQDRVEHPQGEAALVAARHARRAEAEVVLLRLLLVERSAGRSLGRVACAGRRPRRRRRPAPPAPRSARAPGCRPRRAPCCAGT